jgi:hypothetical protein
MFTPIPSPTPALLQVGGPAWVWRIVQYMRKRAQQPMDIELVLYSLVAACDTFSFALCIVLLLVGGLAASQPRSKGRA